jgi:predicted RNA polymerase sigma factor
MDKMEKTVEQNTEITEAFKLMDECLRLVNEINKAANQTGKDYAVKWVYGTIEICREFLGNDIKGYGQDAEIKQRIIRAKKMIEILTERIEML